MTSGLSLRYMKQGEEGEVCALAIRVFDKFVAHEFPPEGIAEFLRYAQPAAMAERSKAENTVFVAEEADHFVGMLELRGFGHIAMLFVDTPGRGVGKKLVQQALEFCRKRAPGVDAIRVHASRYAVPIYSKMGFEAEGSERTENGITYLPMVFRRGADG